MSIFLPPRAPHFDAALRDAREASPRGRATAALVLGRPPPGREQEARTALARLCKDPEGDVRFAAMASLGEVGDESVVEVAIAGIDDETPQVREASVIATGRMGGPGAEAALRRAARSEHGEVRFQAGPALVELCGEAARTEVIVLLADERPSVRANAARALSELPPHAPTATRLARMLDETELEPRLEAALALAAQDDEVALPTLRALLGERRLADEQLFAVLDALGRMGDEVAAPHFHRLATAMLKPRAVKAAAAAALARIGDARGAGLLRPFLVGLLGDQRDFALGVVAALGLVELAPEVVELAGRGRGASPDAIAAALVALAPRDERVASAKRKASDRGGELAEAITAAERAPTRDVEE